MLLCVLLLLVIVNHIYLFIYLTADDAAELGNDVFDANHAAGAIFALREQIAIHLVDDVADRLLADLEIVRLRTVPSGVHDRRHVDTAAFADEPPDETRNERHNRLLYALCTYRYIMSNNNQNVMRNVSKKLNWSNLKPIFQLFFTVTNRTKFVKDLIWQLSPHLKSLAAISGKNKT